MPYRVSVGSEGLRSLEAAWRDLESRTPCHVFQTYDFQRSWLEHVGARSHARPLLVTLEEDGMLGGLFPAAVVGYGPLRLLGWMGSPYFDDYGDVLHDPSAGVAAGDFVSRALSTLRKYAPMALPYLDNVREDAVAHPALTESLRVYKRGAAPYLDTSGDFDAYVASRSRNSRQQLKKILRRLRETGDLRFSLLEKGDPKTADVVRDLMEMKHRRYGGQPAGATEFRVDQALSERDVRVATLTLDGRMIAADLLAERAGRMYSLAPAFDEELSAFAPGRALFYHSIGYCFERDIDVFDFTCGDESYKYHWTDTAASLATFVGDDLPGRVLSVIAGARRKLADREGSRRPR